MTEKIPLPNGLARSIIAGHPDDWQGEEDFDEAAFKAFNDEFEFVTNRALGNPKESWYQGVNFTAVIRRKSDGALFGFPYWESIAKYGESYYEPNGDEHGYADDCFVFLPVKAFHVEGYEVQS